MTNKNIHNQFKQIVNDILVSNGFEVSNGEKYFDFYVNNESCRLCVHKLTGVIRKNMVIEYVTDTKSDLRMVKNLIFINPEDPKCVYMISSDDLYDQLNWGIQYDRRNFKITNNGDILCNKGLSISVNIETFKNLTGLNTYEKKNSMINPKDIRDGNKNAIQYEPLVNKITKQFVDKVASSWDDIKSMAWEGLVIAFNTYDESKSNMNFTQFAAFSIRNNILTSLDNELRTVKMSNYAQKKATEVGETVFNSVRVDVSAHQGEDENKSQEIRFGMYENEKFSDGNVYDYLYMRLDGEFSQRDCQMFYMSFGLKNYDIMKGKDIALKFGVSEGLVSQKIKNMCKYIRKDNDLCEMLANLM